MNICLEDEYVTEVCSLFADWHHQPVKMCWLFW